MQPFLLNISLWITSNETNNEKKYVKYVKFLYISHVWLLVSRVKPRHTF